MFYSFLVHYRLNGTAHTNERSIYASDVGQAIIKVTRLPGYISHQFIRRSRLN